MFQLIRAIYLDSNTGPKHGVSLQTLSIKKKVYNEVLLLLLKVTGINRDQLLVTVLPGLPTTAEIFIVPEKRPRHGAMDEKWAHLDQVLSHQIILTAPGRCSLQCGFL